jgi:hypothetical protein
MEELFVFVHRQGNRKMAEIAVDEAMTVADLLRRPEFQETRISGVPEEILVFFGDSEHPSHHDANVRHCHTGHDGRVHLTKCHRVKVTVHYTHLTHEKEFPPGTRLKKVKEWAVAAFHVPAHDATEHVLEIHGTKDHPNTSEPLSLLVHGHDCGVVFDLVPDIRVEG